MLSRIMTCNSCHSLLLPTLRDFFLRATRDPFLLLLHISSRLFPSKWVSYDASLSDTYLEFYPAKEAGFPLIPGLESLSQIILDLRDATHDAFYACSHIIPGCPVKHVLRVSFESFPQVRYLRDDSGRCAERIGNDLLSDAKHASNFLAFAYRAVL